MLKKVIPATTRAKRDQYRYCLYLKSEEEKEIDANWSLKEHFKNIVCKVLYCFS